MYVIKKQYLCTRKGLKHEKMKNRMFNFTPPRCKNVASVVLGLLLILWAALVVWLGYRDTRHNNTIVWAHHIPELYTPIFYNSDSLYHYIFVAYHEDDPEALCIAGTAAYNVQLFDKAAQDSLPFITLEDADIMLLRSAHLGYAPAFTIINYLEDLGLWSHSLPTNEPTYVPDAPAKDDPNYVPMIAK